MGAFQRNDRAEIKADMDRVFELFPRLQERRDQKAGTMSGGEQQMCAIGRALMARPKLLLLDEPSLGLAPIFVERIFDIIRQINEQGTSILLVEQNALMALDAARPRLRARDRPHRARRQRRSAEDERAGAQDLPRRDLAVTRRGARSTSGRRREAPRPSRAARAIAVAPSTCATWSLSLIAGEKCSAAATSITLRALPSAAEREQEVRDDRVPGDQHADDDARARERGEADREDDVDDGDRDRRTRRVPDVRPPTACRLVAREHVRDADGERRSRPRASAGTRAARPGTGR